MICAESLAQRLAHSRCSVNTSSFSLLLTYSRRMGQWWRRRKAGSKGRGEHSPGLGVDTAGLDREQSSVLEVADKDPH